MSKQEHLDLAALKQASAYKNSTSKEKEDVVDFDLNDIDVDMKEFDKLVTLFHSCFLDKKAANQKSVFIDYDGFTFELKKNETKLKKSTSPAYYTYKKGEHVITDKHNKPIENKFGVLFLHLMNKINNELDKKGQKKVQVRVKRG